MKRILIAILLATICQGADTDYKIYIVGETARFDENKGKCLDMKGNLLYGKADVRSVKDGWKIGTLCIDGEAIEERGYWYNGELYYIKPYKNGKFEGVAKFFYRSGRLEAEEPYKNGVKDGITKGYYESGKLKYETPYKNGKAEGVDKAFYESGKLKREAPFKNDYKDGIQNFYYEDGKLKEEWTWKNRALEGEKHFRKNGTISRIVTYEKGKAISGACYKTNGEKVPLTEAELENSRNGFNATCD
ncbi:MAG: toxin-antitoxin system YwqK family antitoxin [Helicobacteraceae bacterium]|jgi:hypothetical protein|nr:toxin-antitoxin system YwqK family antitoxin [Helicobacteraceae bacterium]